MKNLLKYKLSFFFIFIIFGLSLFDIINEDKSYSALENRNLSSSPTFTFNKFIKGDFSKDYEKYINDQFIMRDNWINTKSFGELMLMKQENNGIIYGKEGYLFEKLTTVDEEKATKNITNILNFLSSYKGNKSFMIVPNSYEVYKDLLPKNINLVNQKKYINQIYTSTNNYDKEISTIDILPTLVDNNDKYLYYKTDHHWTTEGAYLAYKYYIESLGLAPMALKNSTTIGNFYGTYFAKSKNINQISDRITYYNFPNVEVTIDGKQADSLYDTSKFETVDKYAAFLQGNNGLTVLKNKEINKDRQGKKMLLIKDSYSNCFAPFLTENFEEVWIIDLRSYSGKLSGLLKETKFDELLIEYSFSNLINDNNIVKFNW